MIAAIIIACEIAFWLFVLSGLICRYILKQKRLGAILLYCTPLIDLLLIIATVIDLRSGTPATFIHSLAAVYIGVSLAFGHQIIAWADQGFAYHFAGGAKPPSKPKYGSEHARLERRNWLRHLFAWMIGCIALYGMILLVGNPVQTEVLLGTIQLWSFVLTIDFLYSFSYSLWPRKTKNVS